MSESSSAKALIQSTPPMLYPHALAAAWLWPGLGHIVLGQRRRGLLIMFGVLFLFFSGLLIGGIDSIDSKDARLWFYAQFGNGPIAIVVDQINQRTIKSLPDAQRFRFLSIGHVNEIGTLFIALAGLMNVAVMLDALQPRFPVGHEPPPAERRRRRQEDRA